MHVLSIEKQAHVIACLTEGCGIRPTGRLTKVHRDTVMRLGLRVGEGCRQIHDRLFRYLHVKAIQIDELWSYVGKKQKRVTAKDGQEVGDQYIFTALDPMSRCLLAAHIGKRDMENTLLFLTGLRERVFGRPQISSDAFAPYSEAIACTFGTEVDYAHVVKPSKDSPSSSPPWLEQATGSKEVSKHIIWGDPIPARISTSLVERSNLTARQHSRRLTRMTNGFSKRLRNHHASLYLQLAYYNLCRIHAAVDTAPAVALGVTNRPWTIEELIRAAKCPDDLPTRLAPFTLIRGGLS